MIPLSLFTQLVDLINHRDNMLDKFHLIAIVLHNPHDEMFKQTMYRAMDRLHETTGQGMAFITFLEPSNEWVSRNMLWMDNIKKALSEGSNCSDEAFLSDLRSRLRIEGNEPCIILTNDLNKKNFYVLQSSPGNVVHQLESLGKYVTAHLDHFSTCSYQFLDLLDELDYSTLSTKDGRSVAENIADLSSLREISAKGHPDDPFLKNMVHHGSMEYAVNNFKRLQSEYFSARESENTDIILKTSDLLFDYIAQILASRELDLPSRDKNWHTFDIETFGHISPRKDSLANQAPKEEDLEPNTVRYLNTYRTLRRAYFFDNWNELGTRHPGNNSFCAETSYDSMIADNFMFLSDKNANGKDYSALGTYLGKILEEELNSSVVQLIRKGFGIPMPDNYRKIYSKGNTYPVETKNRTLLFNGFESPQEKNKLKTLASGELCAAIRNLPQYNLRKEDLGIYGGKQFLNSVQSVASMRNLAAHMGAFDFKNFESMYGEFMHFYRTFIPEMIETKKGLR